MEQSNFSKEHLTSIVKATEGDFQLLTDIGKKSFIESHGKSASLQTIDNYVFQKYNNDIFKTELTNPKNIYHLIYQGEKPAGYSKIIFNTPHSNIQKKNVTKLERLYLLKEYYGLKLGFKLLNFNIELSKQNQQSGMWLYVWQENYRALNFYTQTGFTIIGSHDFALSNDHSNPNHQMLLTY